MNLPKLDSRLETALTYLRKGKIMADIGTDHAYLPIYSVLSGISSAALASDINQGPCERADKNVRAYGLADKIKVVCCDGLAKAQEFSPDDIIIFGMGGELIAKIIDEAPFVKNENIRFILQPMTKAEILREYLAKNGFCIVSETLSEAVGRQYFTVCAEFDGSVREYNEIEYLLGKFNLENNRNDPIFAKIIDRNIRAAEIKIAGKEKAGDNAAQEKALLGRLNEIKEGHLK